MKVHELCFVVNQQKKEISSSPFILSVVVLLLWQNLGCGQTFVSVVLIHDFSMYSLVYILYQYDRTPARILSSIVLVTCLFNIFFLPSTLVPYLFSFHATFP